MEVFIDEFDDGKEVDQEACILLEPIPQGGSIVVVIHFSLDCICTIIIR